MAKISKKAKSQYQRVLGEKIKAYREHRNITMAQLAEKIGKTQATVSRYEAGEIGMTQTALDRIIDYLQISPSDLPKIQDYEDFKDEDSYTMLLSYTHDGVVQTDKPKSVSIPPAYNDKYKSLILVSVDTDLIDQRVNRDAILLIDLDTLPKNGSLAYFNYEDSEMIYEYRTDDQSIILQPSSNRIADLFGQTGDAHEIIINKNNPIERKKLNIIGKVVGYLSDITKEI